MRRAGIFVAVLVMLLGFVMAIVEAQQPSEPQPPPPPPREGSFEAPQNMPAEPAIQAPPDLKPPPNLERPLLPQRAQKRKQLSAPSTAPPPKVIYVREHRRGYVWIPMVTLITALIAMLVSTIALIVGLRILRAVQSK